MWLNPAMLLGTPNELLIISPRFTSPGQSPTAYNLQHPIQLCDLEQMTYPFVALVLSPVKWNKMVPTYEGSYKA